MPRVSMKTGFMASDDTEEVLTEYLCDSPDCPNVATQVLGCVRELRLFAAVCDQHAPKPGGTQPVMARKQGTSPDRP